MTFDFPVLAYTDPKQLWLELSPTTQSQAWQQSESFSAPVSRWNAYLNRIALEAFLPWLQAEYAPEARAWPNYAALPSIWELVNGTMIVWGTTRLALLPSETLDLSELRVPLEWVDIPELAADYYLAVQVNPDSGWIRIWGYTTHLQLLSDGHYAPSDRTYCLDEDDLIDDLNILWVARQLCPQEPTKSAITALPTLPQEQANNLLQRLGNSQITTPRLAVPFPVWGALLAHGGWRQHLYQLRLGLPEQWSLLQWLRGSVSQVAQELGWQRLEFQSSLGAARGNEPTLAPLGVLSRQLLIAGQPYELRVIPQGDLQQRVWRFELRNDSVGEPIPRGFKLRLLTEDLQPFEKNEATATKPVDRLYIQVALEPGEGLVWEIEPTPENYDREIMRF